MEGLELISFEIISNVGMSKSLSIEAIREARKGSYENADENLKRASQYLTEGHHAHASLIQQEAAGEKVDFSLILMHAEDQLMSAEAFGILAEEFIELYKILKEKSIIGKA